MAEPLKFFADLHLPLDAIDQLRLRGVDIIRSLDAGFPQHEEGVVLLEYATQNQRIMVSCDGDFPGLHNMWLAQGKEHGGIIYFNMAKGYCSDIGRIVTTIVDYHEAVVGGAGTYEDLYNHLIFG